jgi:hypothetical protein
LRHACSSAETGADVLDCPVAGEKLRARSAARSILALKEAAPLGLRRFLPSMTLGESTQLRRRFRHVWAEA